MLSASSSSHGSSLGASGMRYSEDGYSEPRGTMGGRKTEMMITAMEPEEGAPPERMEDYKGRLRIWPGVVFILVMLAGATAFISLGAVSTHNKSVEMARAWENGLSSSRRIKDGTTSTGDLISDDGQVGNPRKYPDMGCELPNYLSKDGKIIARSSNGTEVPVGIKGVNWFGMETANAIPFGLWENQENGTSAYEIASFLARNKFNSIRLPVCIKHILKNTAPKQDLVNLNSNRALNISTYMTTLTTLVQALAFRHVTVLISLHTLDPSESGGAWYSASLGVSEDDFLSAVDTLTENLCSDKYWNVIGIDLKNEPHQSTWGGAAPDWQKGATLIGNRMLKGCPNWLAFVEGVNGKHEITLADGRTNLYWDWWGGGLEAAGEKPVELQTENKVVWAPHYYNTGVSPHWYLYKSGKQGADASISDYVELDDEPLKANVKQTMDAMFGYLATPKKNAMILGEFAGLYAKDAHPRKTTKRTTDFTMDIILAEGWAGAYMWSINPESAYQFNPADTPGSYREGLLSDDWLTPNAEFLKGLSRLDRISNLRLFPCFPKASSS